MRKILLLALCIALISPSAAFAGRSCEEREILPSTLQKATDAALRTFSHLQNTGAQVALLGRVGADLSEHNLKYSHMGIALRDHKKGKWFVVHELNTCGASISEVYDEGLVNFYLDDPHSYDTSVTIPSPELQERLVRFLDADGANKIHNPKYSMISNPFSGKYQNSNEFVLAAILSAQYPLSLTDGNPNKIAAWLKVQNYTPSTIRIGFLKRLGASLFKANVAFDDHRGTKLEFVSVRSIINYIQKTDSNATTREL
jgi:hypothetical protein